MLQTSIIATTKKLGLVAGKETSRCFIGPHYAARDEDIDRWLPERQPKAASCTVTTLATSGGAKFSRSREMAYAGLAVTTLGLRSYASVESLEKLLEDRGYLMTLTQVERMVARAERARNASMLIGGLGNFFFTQNKHGGISVANIRCYEGRWSAYLYELTYREFYLGDVYILVPNFKTPERASWP